ncbi:MAG: RNA methyltransferase [Anaerolineales bacterium]
MESLPLISSRANPTLKLARSLHNRKDRAQTSLFLVEGILHVGEAAEAGWEIETLLYAPERLSSAFARQLVEDLTARGVRCQPVAVEAFESIAEKDNPQGVAAIVRQRVWRFEDVLARGLRLAAACVSPQDPGNVGTILRTLDAVGADALFLLDGGVDPFHPSVVRASMGALFWKPVVQTSFDAFVQWAHAQGMRLIGTSARGSVDYRAFHPGNVPLVLVLGSEQKGLTPAQLDACDALVRLPMRGRGTSLNLAVAAGILLYALTASFDAG